MTAGETARSIPPEGPGSVRLWAGVTVGPLAWVAQLVLDWGLSEVIACAPATEPPPTILGVSLPTALLIVTLVLFTATVVSGLGAWAHLRTSERAGISGVERFLAVAGIMTSVLFAIVIAAGFLPIYLTEGCLP